MSAELKDFRCKITVEADCVIEAEARSTGRDKAEIAREWLHEKAKERIHAAKLLDNLLRAEGAPGIGEGAPRQSAALKGAPGIGEGIAGKMREDQGKGR